ncbi:mannosyltransferase [Ceratocystis pirilliformis]|uniref:Mannosyltransferase n=1 Tax=Ceratocystis pirilliformis TaxID=259994 RepID=A0ABR3YM18_9PEZI
MRFLHLLGLAFAATPISAWKYFHEPGGSLELGHYDARYFNETVSYDDHLPALRYLIRSYLKTLREHNVETWIAHGSLLGWWWNGQIMPWDYDLDVQVSSSTLLWLGDNMNRTKHEYTYEENGKTQTKHYLLDINPFHSQLTRGNGHNIIDARWIDMSNGMFIDITGVAERDPVQSPGIWSCRNNHRYKTTDLYPMRYTEFEGVPTMVPYNFERILIDEYSVNALVTTEWLGHRWSPESKKWLKVQ